MKIIFFSFAIILTIAGLNACYYDKAELLYPSEVGNCDTSATVSYISKVVPILNTQCYSCHTGASAGGGIVMGTNATDKAIGLNGKLVGSITYASGFSPMPKGAAKMNACDIAIIKKWIAAGCPNN
jgi:mono/diheme cytochrome c family protein